MSVLFLVCLVNQAYKWGTWFLSLLDVPSWYLVILEIALGVSILTSTCNLPKSSAEGLGICDKKAVWENGFDLRIFLKAFLKSHYNDGS